MTSPSAWPIFGSPSGGSLMWLRSGVGPSLALGADHWWTFNEEAAFDFEAELTPADFTVGQHSDDVASLPELLRRSHDDVALWHDLRHVVGVPPASQCRIGRTGLSVVPGRYRQADR
jgi:hypothetical protein